MNLILTVAYLYFTVILFYVGIKEIDKREGIFCIILGFGFAFLFTLNILNNI